MSTRQPKTSHWRRLTTVLQNVHQSCSIHKVSPTCTQYHTHTSTPYHLAGVPRCKMSPTKLVPPGPKNGNDTLAKLVLLAELGLPLLVVKNGRSCLAHAPSGTMKAPPRYHYPLLTRLTKAGSVRYVRGQYIYSNTHGECVAALVLTWVYSTLYFRHRYLSAFLYLRPIQQPNRLLGDPICRLL